MKKALLLAALSTALAMVLSAPVMAQSTSASAGASSSASALPETGGPASALALVPLALLVGTGLLVLGTVRRE